MSKLAKVLAVLAVAAVALGEVIDESSGDGSTRPRPDEMTTEAPRMEKSKCKCYLFMEKNEQTERRGKKHQMIKLEDFMGDAADEVDLTYVDSPEGCGELESSCLKHCTGLASNLFVSGYSAKPTEGKYKSYTVGETLCYNAHTSAPLSINIVGSTDNSCYAKYGKKTGYSHAFHGREKFTSKDVSSFTMADSLCCKLDTSGYFYTSSACDNTEPSVEEESSGDGVTRPRPDELLETQTEGSGDEVTRPRPDETTTEAPRMEKSKCKCYLFTKKNEQTQKRDKKHHMIKLEDFMGDAADEVDLTYVDSPEGCGELESSCLKHCSGLASKLFVSGYSAKPTAGKYKRYTVGETLCYNAHTSAPLSINIVGSTDNSCYAKYGKKTGYSHAFHGHEDSTSKDVSSFTMADSLCCKLDTSGYFYTSSACGTNSSPDSDDSVTDSVTEKVTEVETRPQPDETSTDPPKMRETKCDCYLNAKTAQASRNRAIKLHHFIGDDAENIMLKYPETDDGCQQAMSSCSKHCAGLATKMFTNGYSSQPSEGRYKKYTIGDTLCQQVRTTSPLSVEVTGRLHHGCSTTSNDKHFFGHGKPSQQEVSAFSVSDSLCCKRGWRSYFSVACNTN